MAESMIPQAEIDNWLRLKPISKVAAPPKATPIYQRFLEREKEQGLMKEKAAIERKRTDERKAAEMHAIQTRACEIQRFVQNRVKQSLDGDEIANEEWIRYDFPDAEEEGLATPSLVRDSSTPDTLAQPRSTRNIATHYYGGGGDDDRAPGAPDAYDPTLPITKHREEILATIAENPIVVIEGATGSGKSTQVPQYILDRCVRDGVECSIVCTQPRKVAATSVARRVCDERDWRLGGVVGYQVGMATEVSEDTRLTYVTTGVLLRKLVKSKDMNAFTHVIIDEVHERDQLTDFVLLVVRKFLRSNSKKVKVILMSATLDSKLFSNYFSFIVDGGLVSAPVIQVEGKAFPVKEFYLEDFSKPEEMIHLDEGEPEVTAQGCVACQNLIESFDDLEKKKNKKKTRGSVLIFVPGYQDIVRIDQLLRAVASRLRLWIVPLHSEITREEQRDAFLPPRPEQRKVIISTNIAESSVTIPDVRYVIDFCLTKELTCDPETNYQALLTVWASISSLTQRKGRAGRVAPGRCYRMITRNFQESFLRPYGTPEMQRQTLEQLLLQVKLLDVGEPKAVLGLALEPPNLDSIEKTVLRLKEVGALSVLKSGRLNPHDGDLAFTGQVLAHLPVDIKLGKLILLGHVFGCLEEAVIVAAALSLKSFFARPYQLSAQVDAFKSKWKWSESSHSDAIAMINAFFAWKIMSDNKGFPNRKAEFEWGRRHAIQINVIREAAALVDELHSRLGAFNIRTERMDTRGRTQKMTEDDIFIFEIVMAGAFYPNYFHCSQVDERSAVKEVGGLDMLSSVVVQGLPIGQSHLLGTQLIDLFVRSGKGKRVVISSSKAFIEFHRLPSEPPKHVANAVYCALMMRKLRVPLEIALSNKRVAPPPSPSPATSSSQLAQVKLPNCTSPSFPVIVTAVLDAGHFWAVMADGDTTQTLAALKQSLRRQKDALIPIKNPSVGQLCLAPYQNDDNLYRGRIVELNMNSVLVHYLDYGNCDIVLRTSIKVLPLKFQEYPAQAFECFLSHIRPSYRQPASNWTSTAKSSVCAMVNKKTLLIKIFSKLDRVLRVNLIDATTGEHVSINQALISQGHAELAEEPIRSQMAHDDAKRAAAAHSTVSSPVAVGNVPSLRSTPPGKTLDPMLQRVCIKGPSSPLEMKFYHVPAVGKTKEVRVNRSSVNCIALDESPGEKSARLMVSASVTLSPSGDAILANNTTILPKLPGLPALLTILFAPFVEMRTDSDRRIYVGCIAGLGYDAATGESFFPEHDIDIVFDSMFFQEDLANINDIRHAIGVALGSEDRVCSWNADDIKRIQAAARSKVLRLVRANRSGQNYSGVQSSGWNKVPVDAVLRPPHRSSILEKQAFLYELHCGVKLLGASAADLREKRLKILKMEQHLADLKRLSLSADVPLDLFCELCRFRAYSTELMRNHLRGSGHVIAYKSWREMLN